LLGVNGATSAWWRKPWRCEAERGSEAWIGPDWVEEAFVTVVATAAHLLRIEPQIWKAAAF